MTPAPHAAREWTLIVNPVSGRGHGEAVARELRAAFDAAGVTAHFKHTRAPMHATVLAAEAVNKGCRHLAAVGGDGTVNEVVNGLMDQAAVPADQVMLATVPVGTGNDWARSLGCPKAPVDAVRAMLHAPARRLDLGRLHYRTEQGPASRYFANLAGAGFDAFVLQRMGGRKSGTWTYLATLLAGVRHYRAPNLRLSREAGVREGRAMVVFAAIGRYGGGGMQFAPGAALDDGRLDVIRIGAMSGWQVVKELRRLFDGSLLRSEHIEHWQADALAIDTDEPVGVEVDGEWVGVGPARAEVLPQALWVVGVG